jgi:dephospho-CoA kinase
MRVVGLSGSIATGKSTVSSQIRAFKEYPVRIIDADKVARFVQRPGKPAFQKIVKYFGNQVVAKDGTLDRLALGDIVFNDVKKRKVLEKFTHPYIRRQMLLDLCWYFLAGSEVVILDVPLLFEGGLNKFCYKSIVVFTTAEQQLQRLMRRDQSTETSALARINAQWSQEKKKQMADLFIDNSGTQDETLQQTVQVLRDLKPGPFVTLLFRIVLGPFVLLLWLIIVGIDALGF